MVLIYDKDDDDNRIVRDGEILQVSMMMADSAIRPFLVSSTGNRTTSSDSAPGQRPEFAARTEEQAEASNTFHAQRKAAIGNAWRTPAQVGEQKPGANVNGGSGEDFHAKRMEALSNAWRHPR